MTCLSCHGVRGSGGSGGRIRGASTSKIVNAIQGERDMRYLQGYYTYDELRRIASYLAY